MRERFKLTNDVAFQSLFGHARNERITKKFLERILGIEIEEGDYDTLSGYLQEKLGRIPKDEEKPVIETNKITYKVEEYEDKRIIKVKACKNNIEEIED